MTLSWSTVLARRTRFISVNSSKHMTLSDTAHIHIYDLKLEHSTREANALDLGHGRLRQLFKLLRRINMYTYTYTDIHVYIYRYIHMYMYDIYICIYTTYIQHIYTYIHIHIHIYTWNSPNISASFVLYCQFSSKLTFWEITTLVRIWAHNRLQQMTATALQTVPKVSHQFEFGHMTDHTYTPIYIKIPKNQRFIGFKLTMYSQFSSKLTYWEILTSVRICTIRQSATALHTVEP